MDGEVVVVGTHGEVVVVGTHGEVVVGTHYTHTTHLDMVVNTSLEQIVHAVQPRVPLINRLIQSVVYLITWLRY